VFNDRMTDDDSDKMMNGEGPGGHDDPASALEPPTTGFICV
jgi:hypothetical protein